LNSDSTRVEPFLPLAEPSISGNEWVYVRECLDTGWISSAGEMIGLFEKELAAWVGTRHAIATSSGTAAIHLSLLAAGIKPGEEVITSTMTFIAPANTIRYVGAWPTLMDAEPDYWQMDPNKLADFLREGCMNRDGQLFNKATDRRVAAIMPVHILGNLCDIDAITELANRYELPVIEDATEGLGATRGGRQAGTFGVVGCLSFNGNKLISTGGGGMVVTDDDDIAQSVRHLSTQAKTAGNEYIHDMLGFNYRMTNVLAAIGRGQLEQIEDFIAAKRSIAGRYADAFSHIDGITAMRQPPGSESTFWLYTILVDADRYGINSRQLMQHLEDRNIQSRPLWQPMHRSEVHKDAFGWDLTVADKLYAEGLSIPSSVSLNEQDQIRVISAIKDLASSS
jgi:perosamine synthetase